MIFISRQCELLDICRSSYYYCPKDESSYNLILMKLIDEQYILKPFYGVPRMTVWLRREGHLVNPKRVRRLMRLEAIYPKPRLSQSCPGRKRYPYLLKGLVIDHSDQVWCSDITYIRLLHRFVYLTVVMDWFSRYVLSWELSITLDKEICLKALEKALSVSKPEIFNTDQGAQFTNEDFTVHLEDAGVRIIMPAWARHEDRNGKDRIYDNIFVERLWRTVKYEEVYLLYNSERLHKSLGYQTPYEVYFNEPYIGMPDAQKAALEQGV